MPIPILGALTLDGLAAVMTVEGGTDQQVFLTYLDKVLLPALDEGDILVLDNLAAHRVDAVRRTVEAAGLPARVSTSLLARCQPHRNGLVQAQRLPSDGSGSDP